ncbi:MAG: hypothetical protein AB7F65_03740 [Dehalococcoidia bacterium]
MRYDFGAALAGLIVIALGVAFMLDALDVAELRFEVLLPIFAIAVGVAAILSSVLRTRRE